MLNINRHLYYEKQLILKKRADIFSYICHFIFAIILANSYETATSVLIDPGWEFLSNGNTIISGMELLLAYTITISGWVGYSRSMIKWPHTNIKSGTTRFILDLLVLFFYFWLISSAGTENEFNVYFLHWIVGLFVLFAMWDILKIKEHHKKSKTARQRQALYWSFLKTVVFGVIYLIIAVSYQPALENQTELITEQIIYVIWLGMSIGAMMAYRYWKWSIEPQPNILKL